MTQRGAFARELAVGVAGLGALGAVGLVDAKIADDVDFTAIYIAPSPWWRGAARVSTGFQCGEDLHV